jgi:hypothetical protein
LRQDKVTQAERLFEGNAVFFNSALGAIQLGCHGGKL